MLSTRLDRQLALLVVVMLTSQLVHRAIGFTFDEPVTVLLTEERGEPASQDGSTGPAPR